MKYLFAIGMLVLVGCKAKETYPTGKYSRVWFDGKDGSYWWGTQKAKRYPNVEFAIVDSSEIIMGISQKKWELFFHDGKNRAFGVGDTLQEALVDISKHIGKEADLQ